MKIIITEQQLNLLEGYLNEVSTPMTDKIVEDGLIEVVYLDNENQNSQLLIVDKLYGSGEIIGVSSVDDSNNFLIDIGRSLDTTKNTFTLLKSARYKDGYKDQNGKVFGPEIIGGAKIVIKNVLQIIVKDSTNNVVDEVNTSLGDEKLKSNDDYTDELRRNKEKEDNDVEDTESDKRKVYDLVMNDATLKKAFYSQPSILSKLLNYGKDKGFGPAKALITKYLSDDDEDEQSKKDKEFKRFRVNKFVLFENLNKPIRVTNNNVVFELSVGKTYKAKYIGKQELVGKKGKLKYKINLLENMGNDIYDGLIKIYFPESDGSISIEESKIIIKIKDYSNSL